MAMIREKQNGPLAAIQFTGWNAREVYEWIGEGGRTTIFLTIPAGPKPQEKRYFIREGGGGWRGRSEYIEIALPGDWITRDGNGFLSVETDSRMKTMYDVIVPEASP